MNHHMPKALPNRCSEAILCSRQRKRRNGLTIRQMIETITAAMHTQIPLKTAVVIQEVLRIAGPADPLTIHVHPG